MLGVVRQLLFVACALASSIPPENQKLAAHLSMINSKTPFLAVPIEAVYNSLISGGREVDPNPSWHSPSVSAVNTSGVDGAHDSSRQPSAEEAQLAAEEGRLTYTPPANSIDSDHTTTTTKRSVVPRKGVTDPKPRVIPRKGVTDPKPRVIPRKGVHYNSSDDDMMSVTTNATVSTEVASTTEGQLDVFSISSTTTLYVVVSGYNDIPKPPTKLSSTESSLDTFKGRSSTPPADEGETTDKPALRHAKPPLAVDSVANKPFNSTPVIIGVVCGVVVIVSLAILAYKKLEDVWSRRHYDRMDFLIDGMYDL